LKQKRGSLNNF